MKNMLVRFYFFLLSYNSIDYNIALLYCPTDQPEMMRFENEKLREELERLKKVIGTGGQGANQKLLQENALLVSQVSLNTSLRVLAYHHLFTWGLILIS